MQNYDNVETIRLEDYWKRVQYTFNGQLHRTDGPAVIEYHSDGTVSKEKYYLNGQKHEEDGPAEIWYFSDGTIQKEFYYLHGVRMEHF